MEDTTKEETNQVNPLYVNVPFSGYMLTLEGIEKLDPTPYELTPDLIKNSITIKP
jgi:hypothetical protein